MKKNNFPNKLKIINDPIYGFISIPSEIIYDLIEHPFFQRLRRIRQLGLTHLVYPGALHTRFHHAIGAMHLMTEAIEALRSKGVEITQAEEEAVTIAILLHDIGHGPYSHALEHSIVSGINHEDLSVLFMNRLNAIFNGKLGLAIKIFKNEYRKKFLHQLVSSQMDLDRLDYLKRDSFYTGVSEGVISSERIIKMLHVKDDTLVVEGKGIYSVEKFILARRLMYWQVYLHKTVLSAENMLVNILKRARELARGGDTNLFCTPAFHTFLYSTFKLSDFENNNELLEKFAQIDDYDIMASIKAWQLHSDKILSQLCSCMVNRQLYRIELQNQPFKDDTIKNLQERANKKLNLSGKESSYFVFSGQVKNEIYRADKVRINILYKDGTIKDISEASDQLNLDVLAKTVKKYFLCYPKSI